MKNSIVFFNNSEICSHCATLVKNYFNIKTNDKLKQVCENCIAHYPNLTLNAAANKKAMTKTYRINGVYDKREYNKNNFIITLSKRKKNDATELYEILKYLEKQGYNVQLFGYKSVYIGVKDDRTTLVKGQDYALRLKLEYWNNIHYNTEGFKLVVIE